MRKIFIVLALCICVNVYSQPRGFAGKYTIIKTDAINGQGLGLRNIEAEVLLLPFLSASIGYRKLASRKVKTIGVEYDAEYNPTMNYDNERAYYFLSANRARINFNIMEYGIRFYFTNKLVPAPHAPYVFFNHSRGKGSVKGIAETFYDSYTSGVGWTYPYTTEAYNIRDVEIRHFDLGLGNQKVLNNYITIDYGLSFGRTKLDSKTNNKSLYRSAPFIGNHLISSGNLFINSTRTLVSYIDENGEKIDNDPRIYNSKPTYRNIAMFVYLKIGIMIF